MKQHTIGYDAGDIIDYDAIFDGAISDINRAGVKKIEDICDNATGVLSDNKGVEYSHNKRYTPKKETYIVDDEDKKDYSPLSKKPKEKSNIPLRPIKDKMSKVMEDFLMYPDMKGDLYNSAIDLGRYDELKLSQRLNVFSSMNGFGKYTHRVVGITRTGAKIEKHNIWTFGSPDDYNIDTIPLHAIRGKGQEITHISQVSEYGRNRVMLSRRYLSRIINTWSDMVDIRYSYGEGKVKAMEMWGIKLPQYSKSTILINGHSAKSAIKDILFIIRNSKVSTLRQLKEKVSEQLYIIVRERLKEEGATLSNILNDMKDNIYWDFSLSQFAWAYPKIQVDYLIAQLRLLNDKQYTMDLYVPMIHNLYKYPLRCTDIKLKPMTEEQHSNNLGDYDISQYNKGWFE